MTHSTRLTLLFVLLLPSVSLVAFAQTSPPAPAPCPCARPAPPYERAMLFSGGATDWIVHLGLYDAACDAGYPPDVVIATSGGATAAGVLAAYPDRNQRYELLGTEHCHKFVYAPKIPRPSIIPIGFRALGWAWRGHVFNVRPPNLFNPPVFDLDQEIAPDFNRPFPTDANRPRFVLVAGKINPSIYQRSKDDKFFTETYFTDRDTGKHLVGLPSAIAAGHPESYVQRCACLSDEVLMGPAVRASMAEPYMVAPGKVNGELYVGGGVNLWPTEVARTLARQIIVPRNAPLDLPKEAGSHSAFGYAMIKRQRAVEAQHADFWIDLTNPPGPELSFWPEIKHLRLVSGVPADLKEYARKAYGLYRFGYDQARAAFRACKPAPNAGRTR